MRIRNGFVSNSSSSSFILPVSGDKEEVVIKITMGDILNLINGSYEARKNIISTETELKEHFLLQYGSRGDTFESLMAVEEYLLRQYDECLSMIQTKGSIMIGYIDNSEYTIIDLIQKAGGIVEE